MSYDSQIQNGGVYTGLNTEASQVNTVPEYNSLGNYYMQQCPFQSLPGEVPVQCVTISPVWGGLGYTVLQNNLPADKLSDTGYFSLSNAYPTYPNSACLRPFVN